MEDIQFSTRNHGNSALTFDEWENRNRRNWVSSPFNNSQNPIDILREAFIKYIVETPIESNTISIEIHYLQRDEIQSEENVKKMLIAKKKYEDTPVELYTYISGQRDTFNNSELDSLLESLEDKRIIMISLCEVYNMFPRRLRGINRDGNRRYSYYHPHTILIKVLYRNIPVSIINEINNKKNNINTINPDQLTLLENPLANDLLNLPLTSNVWPGMCVICQEGINDQDLCRVNCSVGHIFHCSCVNQWRNTITDFGWNNNCPSCREPINSFVNVTPDILPRLPTEFGKKRKIKNNINLIKKEIKYLSG